jgi:predicted Zn-dependent protease
MKKTIALLLVSICSMGFGQSIQVQNMINYLRNKDFVKAKASADAAAEHEQTKGSSKMWMNRGNVYKAIYADTSKAVREIDSEAEEKALDAYINCLKLDKDNIYKDEVKGSIVQAAAANNRKANFYIANKEYDKANRCYDLLETALPFDFDQGMKRQNITKEKLLYNRFDMFKFAGNKEKTKEYANKLIDIKYKEPKIYTDMTRLSLLDKDTAAALSYIEKGKILFEDNMSLIGTEIDIYLARKRTNELKDKLKAAIEVAPDNELLYAVLGQVNEKTGDIEGAEKQYLKALELKPEFEIVNFKLGALYFNMAAEFNKKLNDLPPKETAKAKEYEDKVKESFKKAAPFLEKAYEATPDKAYKQRLFQIYTRLGEAEKAAKYK